MVLIFRFDFFQINSKIGISIVSELIRTESVTTNSNGWASIAVPKTPDGYSFLFAFIENWSTMSPTVCAITVLRQGGQIIANPDTTITELQVRYYFIKP